MAKNKLEAPRPSGEQVVFCNLTMHFSGRWLTIRLVLLVPPLGIYIPKYGRTPTLDTAFQKHRRHFS